MWWRETYFAEIVTCATRYGVKVQLLADSATQRHGHAVHELVDVHQVGIATGQVLCVAQSAGASWDDADLQQWVGVLEVPSTDSMTCFVVGDGLLLFRVEHKRLLLQTTNDTLDSLFEVRHCDGFGLTTGGYMGC